MSFNNEIDAARIPRHVAIIMDGTGVGRKPKGCRARPDTRRGWKP